jgi:prepilin-type N-terminal cleavage/methylation domain-containing protein
MTGPLRKRARRRARQQGFTLLELMVALAIGTLVVGTVYTLGGASSRAFQEQQRISQLQLATRLAIDRIRRDVALAGFGGLPDSNQARTAGGTPFPGRIIGLQVFNNDLEGHNAVYAMTGASAAGTLDTDRIRIIGNLVTADSYRIQNTAGASGNAILLQNDWQSFRRSFATDGTGTTFDTDLFAEVFAVGSYVHILHPQGYHFVTQITTASLDSSGRTPRLGISPPLPSSGQGSFALCVGCTISPLLAVDYLIAPAPVAFQPRDVEVTGANTVLLRRVVDPFTNAVISQQVVLEYAVELSASVAVNMSAPGSAPNIQWLARGAPIPGGLPGRIRGARVTLSARTQEVDTAFEGPVRGPPSVGAPAGPLTGFQPFTDRIGMSRVRTSMAEIMLPNFANAGL